MEWTSSDVAHSHIICSSIGSKNTLKKKSSCKLITVLKIQSLHNWTTTPSLAAMRRVVDLSHLWPAISSVCYNAQSFELVPREIWCKCLKFEDKNIIPCLRRVFALFNKSIFLRNQSLSNATWFCAKKCKIGDENLYLTKNCFGRNEICCKIITVIWVTCARILRFVLQLRAHWQNMEFSRNCPQISHIHKNCHF